MIKPGFTPQELAALPIIPNPTMVDRHGQPSKRVERMKLGDTGGHALVCHPSRVEQVRAALARDVKRAEAAKQ